jgi:hypothetical protein
VRQLDPEPAGEEEEERIESIGIQKLFPSPSLPIWFGRHGPQKLSVIEHSSLDNDAQEDGDGEETVEVITPLQFFTFKSELTTEINWRVFSLFPLAWDNLETKVWVRFVIVVMEWGSFVTMIAWEARVWASYAS